MDQSSSKSYSFFFLYRYNLGLVNQNLKFFEEALECFHKVQSLVRSHSHVTYQLGKTHELRGEVEVAMEWYLKALALVPTDPGLLKKLGELSDMDGDRQQAYQHYYDVINRTSIIQKKSCVNVFNVKYLILFVMYTVS